jgi:hypothetical protein
LIFLLQKSPQPCDVMRQDQDRPHASDGRQRGREMECLGKPDLSHDAHY